MGTPISRALFAVRYLATLPLRIYRIVVSPLIPPSCIYTPSCSRYALDSIMRHGILRGTILTITRITRCVGAWYDGGEDPVPVQFSFREAVEGYRKHAKKRHRRTEGD
jgi:uncharacterized protein